ncbi:unnamed protein product [Euphydryas editha]|nr:unnamed protein product [Euphydryas editha]
MIWFVFIRCRQTGDITAAAVVFSLGTNSETWATRLTFMILFKETVQDMVQKYLECDSKVTRGTRFHINLHKGLVNIKKRVMMAWGFFVGLGISYVAQPLLTPGRHFAEDLYVVYGLEPMFESPNYEIALISESVSVSVCIFILANITAFIVLIIGYIEAQMLALSDELLNLWDDGVKYYQDTKGLIVSTNENLKIKIINEHISYRLREIITFHITNITLLKQFDRIFRITLAIEFALIIVGIVAELLGRLENTYIELPYTFIQMYIDCLIGQRLIDASNVFEKAVYNCKWENFDKANMKTVLLLLQNSQKPLTLTAGGLTNLDFVCLMSVVKSTYSFYTTLRSRVG